MTFTQDVAVHVALGFSAISEDVWFGRLASKRNLTPGEKERWDARFCSSGDNSARKRRAVALGVEVLAGHGKAYSDGKALIKKLVRIVSDLVVDVVQVFAGFVYRASITDIREQVLRVFFKPAPVEETYQDVVRRLDAAENRGFSSLLTVAFPQDRLRYVTSAMVTFLRQCIVP